MDSGLGHRDIVLSNVSGYGLAKGVITWDNSRGRLGTKRMLGGLCSSSVDRASLLGNWCTMWMGMQRKVFSVVDWDHGVEGGDLAKESAVPLSWSPGPMDPDHVRVVRENFNDIPRLGPFAWLPGI